MTGDAGTIARLSRLLADGTEDARALDERREEIGALLKRAAAGLSREELLVLGVNLHAYYTALETLLERVARLVDEDVPSGATWHRDLLLQMRLELPGLRPALLPEPAIPELDELRKFRHFFRNAYVLDLDPQKMLAHGHRVVAVHEGISRGISVLFRHLEDVRKALARA